MKTTALLSPAQASELSDYLVATANHILKSAQHSF